MPDGIVVGAHQAGATQSPAPAPITDMTELALRLLAGEHLHRCHGQGWSLGAALRPVDARLVRSLTTGFRLVPGDDALPGFDSALSQTLCLDPLVPPSEAMVLLGDRVRQAGGQTGYARQHGLTRSQVGDVTGGHKGMTPAVAQSLGLQVHISYRRVRRAASMPTVTAPLT